MADRLPGLVLILTAVFVGIGPTAESQTESSIRRGREIALHACAGCHAMDGAPGITFQGIQVPTLSAVAGRGWSGEQLQSFIMTPHRPMPATPLPLSEVQALSDYISSLQ